MILFMVIMALLCQYEYRNVESWHILLTSGDFWHLANILIIILIIGVKCLPSQDLIVMQ